MARDIIVAFFIYCDVLISLRINGSQTCMTWGRYLGSIHTLLFQRYDWSTRDIWPQTSWPHRLNGFTHRSIWRTRLPHHSSQLDHSNDTPYNGQIGSRCCCCCCCCCCCFSNPTFAWMLRHLPVHSSSTPRKGLTKELMNQLLLL